MIFYGIIALGLLGGMVGLSYLFPQYGLKLLAAASSKFWALLKPKLFKLKSDYKPQNKAALQGRVWDHVKNKPKDPR